MNMWTEGESNEDNEAQTIPFVTETGTAMTSRLEGRRLKNPETRKNHAYETERCFGLNVRSS